MVLKDIISKNFMKLKGIIMSAIYFMKTSEPFGEFSNFYISPFEFDSRVWKTSEHCYQAMKFENIKLQEMIRALPTAMAAAITGRNQAYPLRYMWDENKEVFMIRILRAKFSQHPHLKDLLLSTTNREIVERSYKDFYWGDGGPNGNGLNRLGYLLMCIRKEFRLQHISVNVADSCP
jgi:ribA/ribD-fused uncharacterized protein